MTAELPESVLAAVRADDELAFDAAASDAAGDDPAGWRMLAIGLTTAGFHRHAAKAQRAALGLAGPPESRRPDDDAFLADLLLRAGDVAAGVAVLRDLVARRPDFEPGYLLLGACWGAAARFERAAAAYGEVLRRSPDNVIALDGFARASGWLGRRDAALAAGRRALELKDRAVARLSPAWKLGDIVPPPFDPARPERNVIAFSLWGEAPRYVETALRNADIARDIYPAWRCRFYCDATVPAGVRDRLAALGAAVVMRPEPSRRFAGLFWRFHVAEDPEVDRFLVRDADSLLTVRERVAVDDWLASDLPFHAMRDWWSHTELLLAGMWGGCGRLLPGLGSAAEAFLKRPQVPHRAIDQQFLAQVVWPAIRGRCLVHDDIYGSLGARPFPPLGGLPPGHHVGMNALGHAEGGAELAHRVRS